MPGLAALCGLGREHFARLFSRSLGVAPARYIQERRIAVAAERLLRSDEGTEAVIDLLLSEPTEIWRERVVRVPLLSDSLLEFLKAQPKGSRLRIELPPPPPKH